MKNRSEKRLENFLNVCLIRQTVELSAGLMIGL